MTGRDCCILFNMISGVGFVKFNALSRYFDDPADALNASVSELMQVRGIGEILAREIAGWRDKYDLDAEKERAAAGGAAVITLADADYPAVLRQIPDPPLCLYAAGTLPDFDAKDFIAVVGSRRASNYGCRVARSLTEQAVASGWGTVSGLAFGIDFCAHDATVKSGGVTVAVLGGGLGRIHPQEHVPLAKSIIASGGAVVSEYPMLFPVSRNSFPRRNRIIAALSRGVLVAEAAKKSGGIITANLAIDYGKAVFAVPGNIDNPMAEGCNELLKNGAAKLTTSFRDVIEEFDPGAAPDLFSLAEPHSEYQAESGGNFSENELKIIAMLREKGESSFDDLAIASDFQPGQLSGLLAALEMKFAILQLPGRRYMLR